MAILKRVINFAVFTIPFFVIKGMDTRTPKEFLCLCLCLLIVLLGAHLREVRPFANRFLIMVVGFQFLSFRLAPAIKINFYGEEWLNIWSYQAILNVCLFAAVIAVISGIRFRKREVNKLLFWMALCGFLMSLYVFVQAAGWDQFFIKMTEIKNPDIGWLTAPVIVGTLGNSTIVSPFIGMTIPLAWYLGRTFWACCMFFAVFLTQSKMGIGSAVIGLTFYFIILNWFILKRKFISILTASFLIFSCIGGLMWYINSPTQWNYEGKFMDNGRLANWKMAYADWNSPPLKNDPHKFTMTGFGPGTYGALYQVRNKSRWGQLHNEFGEVGYNNGIIGLGLFLAFWGSIYAGAWRGARLKGPDTTLILSLISSYTIISLDALGSLPWQIAPTLFYTLVIIGLLQNPQILKEKLK